MNWKYFYTYIKDILKAQFVDIRYFCLVAESETLGSANLAKVKWRR